MSRPKARSLRRNQRLQPELDTIETLEPDIEEELPDVGEVDDVGMLAMTPLDGGPPIKVPDKKRVGGGRITVEVRKAVFLEAYKLSGTVTFASKIAGVHRATHREWMTSDSEFAKIYKEAHEDFIESLEQEAVRRARDGIKREVFYQGEVVGNMQEYSDSLLMFLMKANRAGKYRDQRSVELTGPAGGAMKIEVIYTDEAAMSDEEAME